MKQQTGREDREYWITLLNRIRGPVLNFLSRRKLKIEMPVEAAPGVDDRAYCTHLEAFARVLMGIAPWLELGETHPAAETATLSRREGEEFPGNKIADVAREAIDAATDPASPDRLNFSGMNQCLVDAAFLAQAVLRAPVELWEKLPGNVKDNLASAIVESRVIEAGDCNWLLFSAIVEAALFKMGRDWEPARIDYAVRKHAEWYVGDGVYGDGPHFAWDYYNSFVIQPMLVDVLAAVGDQGDFGMTYNEAVRRSRRWAAVQERQISPEGTVPPVGRSLTYRCGVLQSLAQMALLHELPDEITPAQVRCAMTAVIRRLMDAPGTFDNDGWLRIGFCGAQPLLGERYISTGSLYLCTAAFLPLGLPASDPFWSDPPAQWTSQQIYGGMNVAADHAIGG